jgi:hypothetical protein
VRNVAQRQEPLFIVRNSLGIPEVDPPLPTRLFEKESEVEKKEESGRK